MPIEPGDSWFSPKGIEVPPYARSHRGGSALDRRGGLPLTDPNQTPKSAVGSVGVRRWELSSIVERETAQTAS